MGVGGSKNRERAPAPKPLPEKSGCFLGEGAEPVDNQRFFEST